jgi:carbamoyltransferase
LVNWVLGINAFHGDASACLLADGVLVAAAEEERFRRIKHWAGFPSQAIAWCLREANAQPSDIQHIAINQDVRAAMGRKLLYIVKSRPSFRLLLERAQNKKSRLGVVELLNQNVGSGFSGQVHAVEHTLHPLTTHLLSKTQQLHLLTALAILRAPRGVSGTRVISYSISESIFLIH